MDDRGTHTLKGVGGEWKISAIDAVDGEPRPGPLDPAEAAARRAAIAPEEEGRRRIGTPLLVAGLGVSALVAAALVFAFSRSSEAAAPRPDTIARIDAEGQGFDAVVSMGPRAFPEDIAVGGGKLWIANVGNRTLMQVDPEDDSSQVFGTPSAPTGVAFTDDRVWVTYGFSSDPRRGVDVLDPADAVMGPAQLSVPNGSYPIVADADALWIGDPLGSTVVRYEPASGRSTTVELPDGSGPTSLGVSDDSLWVAAGRQPSVFRIDATDPSQPAERFGTGGDLPTALSVAPDGTVWIVEREADWVLALSESGATRVDVALGGRCDAPSAVEATDDVVWVACSNSSNVISLDPADGSVVELAPGRGRSRADGDRRERCRLGRDPRRLMSDGPVRSTRHRLAAPPLTIVVVSAVVLAACATGDRHLRRPAGAGDRGGTLRVAMVDPAYQGFDPQASYTQSQFELLRCCLVRTLMTYRGLPNFEGTQPVPDLATGHPSMSTDGTTWTFHLRRGIRYAPPMQDVEVTAGDIVRALLRAGTDDPGGGPGAQYLGSIEGFSEYARGDAETIAGVSTPDDHTLQIRQTSSDRSIEHLFAMPFTSPIPPLPGDPDAVLGVATGHPFASTFKGGPPQADGYGPFLVSTGPYMVEGAEDLDLTVPPQEQTPTSGFSPGWWFDDPGSLVLVRNPSWDAATDPSRLALPDRIEVSIAPLDNPYPMLADGETDLVMGENPPPAVLRRVRDVARTPGSGRRGGGKLQPLPGTERGAATVRRCPRAPRDSTRHRQSLAGDDGHRIAHLAPDPRSAGGRAVVVLDGLPVGGRWG